MATAPARVLKGFDNGHRVLGETVVYRAGDVAIENLKAIPGKASAEVFDQNGLSTTVDLQTFSVRADSLIVPDGDGTRPIKPERGHIIEVVRGGKTRQYRVQHPHQNEKPFLEADPYGGVLRIFTVESEVPTAAE